MTRQLEFTQEIADIICDRIANGESLRSICRDDDMPAKVTVFKWLNRLPEFANQYTRARETQADTLFDEIADIADNSANDFMKRGDGELVVDHENIARSRLRIDARKWMAGKLQPKKYGEKVDMTIANPDGSNIMPSRIELVAAKTVDEND